MTFTEVIQHIFISPDEPRLRAGWRVAAQMGIMLALTVVFACPLGVVIVAAPEWLNLALILGTAFPVLISVPLARKFIDRRSIVSLGLQMSARTFTDLLAGVGISLVQIGLIFGVELAFGWAQVEGFAWQAQSGLRVAGGLLLWLLLYMAVGFYEELLSRGYHLQNLEEGSNTFWAVLISSAIFGVGHLTNPNASWVSTLGIMAAGVFLAYGYLRTRRLWLPIGLHIGWNFFLGPVFGFPVSGLDAFHLINLQVSGPELVTGGAFGPEAGLLALLAQILGAGLIWVYTRSPLPGEEKVIDGSE
ncbi:MAG: CPBP family intramembrane metalloprotease [Anaerolineales bacterium]|nr:CPBP family intramembrane metalloprotease [Anaerolineales bacterium]